MPNDKFIHGFGTAPDVAPCDKFKLVDEVQGTDEQMYQRFKGTEAVLVLSAAIHGKPGVFSFGVFMPRSEAEAAQAA